MSHLVLDPQQFVAIDYDSFTFPPVRLETRSSGEDLLMLVWAGDREFLLHDRDVPRQEAAYMDEVRAQVAAFNADTISGWRELAVVAHRAEADAVVAEREALRERQRQVARAIEDAGFAALRARREARPPDAVSPQHRSPFNP